MAESSGSKTKVSPAGISQLNVPCFTEEQIKQFVTAPPSKQIPQAVPLPGTGSSTESPTYRSVLSPDQLIYDYPHIKTLFDAFEAGLKASADGQCLGHRENVYSPITKSLQPTPYIWETYQQISKRRANFGSGLLSLWTNQLKQALDQKFYIGVYSVNRPEWMISDLAAQSYGLATVALYDTLGPETAEYVINHSQLPIIVTSIDKIPNLLKISGNCKKMKIIISMDSFSSHPQSASILKQWNDEKHILLYDMTQIEQIGAKHPLPYRPPVASDVCSICYTSGTTGMPKGAMLTHGGLIAVARSVDFSGINITKNDCHVSYLPLAHVYERCIMTFVIIKGGSVGFFRGDVLTLIDDIGELKPTIFPSVPRLLNRIYDRILAGANNSGSIKAALFKHAYDTKLAHYKATGLFLHLIWDTLVFKKIQALLGGRVRVILTASAPISSETLLFLRMVFGCHVLEAYGSTESNGASSVTWAYDRKMGHVGPPLPCSEIKLVAVPEMKYLTSDKPFARGEICVRGPLIFKGYLHDEEKTKEALTSDGWLLTGDIGYIDDKGRQFIIDRKKNIFKLSQGEYIAPEKLENVYVKSGFIAQIYVHGDSLQNELVGIIVPDQEYCIQFAKEQGILPSETPVPTEALAYGKPPHLAMKQLSESPKFKGYIMKDLENLAKSSGLKGFEFIKAIHVTLEPFSVENNCLTPTFKIKRNEAKTLFKSIIQSMYADIHGSSVVVKAPAKL